mmetsp:Transcript_101313/g.285702  ORF Transcript_101313/g.285702 Transcript_101313/m.285702 type:complete len:202 (+) Transcript_101313:765-1370(+)
MVLARLGYRNLLELAVEGSDLHRREGRHWRDVADGATAPQAHSVEEGQENWERHPGYVVLFARRKLREPSPDTPGGSRFHKQPPQTLQRVVKVANLEVTLPVRRRLRKGPSLQVDAAYSDALRAQTVVAVQRDERQLFSDRQLFRRVLCRVIAGRVHVGAHRRSLPKVDSAHGQFGDSLRIVTQQDNVVLRMHEEALGFNC